MRAFLTCAILTATILTIIPASAQAQTISATDLVDSWYARYLGRHADPVGLADQTRALQRGVPAYAALQGPGLQADGIGMPAEVTGVPAIDEVRG